MNQHQDFNSTKPLDNWGILKSGSLILSPQENNCQQYYLPKIPYKFNGFPIRSFFFYKPPSAVYWDELPNSFLRDQVGDIQQYSKGTYFPYIFG